MNQEDANICSSVHVNVMELKILHRIRTLMTMSIWEFIEVVPSTVVNIRQANGHLGVFGGKLKII